VSQPPPPALRAYFADTTWTRKSIGASIKRSRVPCNLAIALVDATVAYRRG
jgi:hypothetical protein